MCVIGIVNTFGGKIVGVAFFPKAVYIGILSGFTGLTVHVVPKVPRNAVYVPVGGNMFSICLLRGYGNYPWGENVFIVYVIVYSGL